MTTIHHIEPRKNALVMLHAIANKSLIMTNMPIKICHATQQILSPFKFMLNKHILFRPVSTIPVIEYAIF